MNANPDLVAIFSALTDEQKDNVRHHLKAGTRILCGERSNFFVNGDARCPAWLAITGPAKQDESGIYVFQRLCRAGDRRKVRFLSLLTDSDEPTVRASLAAAVGYEASQ